MEPSPGSANRGAFEADDPAFLLRPFEAAFHDPVHFIQKLEIALAAPEQFTLELEAAIKTLGLNLGRNGGREALLVINYLDGFITCLARKKQLRESDLSKLTQAMARARKAAMKDASQ